MTTHESTLLPPRGSWKQVRVVKAAGRGHPRCPPGSHHPGSLRRGWQRGGDTARPLPLTPAPVPPARWGKRGMKVRGSGKDQGESTGRRAHHRKTIKINVLRNSVTDMQRRSKQDLKIAPCWGGWAGRGVLGGECWSAPGHLRKLPIPRPHDLQVPSTPKP